MKLHQKLMHYLAIKCVLCSINLDTKSISCHHKPQRCSQKHDVTVYVALHDCTLLALKKYCLLERELRTQQKREWAPAPSNHLLSYRRRIDWNSDAALPSFIAIKTQKNSHLAQYKKYACFPPTIHQQTSRAMTQKNMWEFISALVSRRSSFVTFLA